MFNVGGGELLLILVIALIVVGPDKLPDLSRKVGAMMSQVRRISGGFQEEMRRAMELEDQASAQQASQSQPSTPTDAPPHQPQPSGADSRSEAEANGSSAA